MLNIMNILIELVFNGVGVVFVNLEWKIIIQSAINLRRFFLLLCLYFIVSSTLLKVRKKKETRKNNPRKPALWPMS